MNMVISNMDFMNNEAFPIGYLFEYSIELLFNIK